MAKENSLGLMEVDIMESLKMENNMEKDFLLILEEILGEVYEKMERELSGLIKNLD